MYKISMITLRLYVLTFVFFTCYFTTSISAQASPWPQPKGKLLLISKTEQFWANDTQNGAFQQRTAGTYAEFGLTPAVTIGGALTYGGSSFSGENGPSVAGFSSREIFLQRQLLADENLTITARLLYAAPIKLQRQNTQQTTTRHRSDGALETALLIGRNFGPRLNRFMAVELGYRPSLGTDADFLRSDITFGYKPDEHWIFFLKSLNRLALTSNDNAVLDYDSYRIEPAIAWRRNNGQTYELGYTADLGGRNITQGAGVYLSFWRQF